MAYARRLTVVLTLVSATVVHAGPCAEEEATLGLTLANRGGALVVETVRADGPAARSGFHVDDEIWQVNATVTHACLDWANTVREARHDRKAVLVLARRGGSEVPLVLGAGVWVPPAEPVVPPVAVRPGAPPPMPPGGPPPTTPPPTLPPEVPVSTNEVIEGLRRLAPAERLPGNLRAYTDALRSERAAVETIAARHGASPETVLGLRAVLRYFAGAEVAWKSIEQQREREHRPPHLPVPEEMTAEYFEDSTPAAVLEEFPFLAPTIVREPRLRLTESAGLWRPVMARSLLWAKGREAIDQLAGALPHPAP